MMNFRTVLDKQAGNDDNALAKQTSIKCIYCWEPFLSIQGLCDPHSSAEKCEQIIKFNLFSNYTLHYHAIL